MPPTTTRVNTYTGYSIGCAVVWAAILLIAQRRLDPDTRDRLRLACGGWWSGWTSATIARAVYPPARRLQPAGQRRLAVVSLGLVALGLGNVIRLLVAGGRPDRETPSPQVPNAAS